MRGEVTISGPPGTEATVEAEKKEFVVHVCGAVKSPGIYKLPAGTRVYEAIAAAGGALPEADQGALNLAAFVQD
ncbi:MAG: hypothetical protein GX493_06910, partial [Firmicutes bacterium]|nr:hypothetical protein [Bacillota bacterium]